VTDRDQLPRRQPAPETNRQSPAPAYGSARRGHKRPLSKLVPFLVLAAIAALIARQEIPAVAEWWEKTFAAEEWTLKQTCRNAVMESDSDGRYLRLVEAGEVHRTADGPYVDNLEIVELSASGVEQKVEYTCYLDKRGELFRLNRRVVPERR
jgi:hypothetical protein